MSSYYFNGQTFAGPVVATTGTFSGNVTVGGTLGVTGTLTGTIGTFTGLVTGTGFKTTGSTAAAVGNGLYLAAANSPALASNGLVALTFSSAQLGTAAAAWQFPAGTGALPGVTVGGTADGLFQVSSGVVGLGGAGTEVARFSATLAQVPLVSVYTWLGSTKLSASANGQLMVTNNAVSGSTSSIVFDALNSNGSKIRNNGGGILNFEDGAATGVAAQTRAGQYLNNNGTYGMFFNTAATFANGGNGTTAFCGIATGSTTALSFDSSQVATFANKVIFNGTATSNGASTEILSIRTSTTTNTGGATINAVAIPAGALVLGVVTRITTTVTGCTDVKIGDGTTATLWGDINAASGNSLSSANFTDRVAPLFYTASENLVLTANGGGGVFTTGVVETILYYIHLTAPTS